LLATALALDAYQEGAAGRRLQHRDNARRLTWLKISTSILSDDFVKYWLWRAWHPYRRGMVARAARKAHA